MVMAAFISHKDPLQAYDSTYEKQNVEVEQLVGMGNDSIHEEQYERSRTEDPVQIQRQGNGKCYGSRGERDHLQLRKHRK